MSDYFVTPVSEAERNAIKAKSAHALPDSPRDYGMKAGQVKPAFWKPLVQGEGSIAALIDRVISEVNASFGRVHAPGGAIHLINTRIRIGVLDPVANPGSYMTPPKSGDVALTTDYDLYFLTVETVNGIATITPEFIVNIRGNPGQSFITDETLSLKNGVLSVNVASEPEPDNTLPISAAAVDAAVGNIEILLKTI